MKAFAISLRVLSGIVGLVLLVLGVLFWTGRALGLVQLHMSLGSFFVLLMWAIATVGARARAPVGLVVLTYVWGLVTAALGMAQVQLVPGAGHWVIQALHLLVGIVAMGLCGVLATRAADAGGRAGGPAPAPPPARTP